MNSLLLFAQVQAPDASGFFAVGGITFLILFLLGLAASIFWIWMLVDALVNEPTSADKILWFLVIFFLHVIGAVVYFVVRKGSRQTSTFGGPPQYPYGSP